MTIQAAKEITDRARPDIVTGSVALGLDVYPVEPKGVLINYAVNTIVAGPAEGAAGVLR